MTRLRLNNGFTLIEALIATALLMLGGLVLEKNFIASIMGNNAARLTTASVAEASALLEEIHSLGFNCRCTDSELLNGCIDLQDRDGVGNDDDMAATIDNAGNVTADLACTWGANGRRVTTTRGNPLPVNLHNNGITVFLNVCEDCPLAAGGFIANSKLLRIISRYRDPGRSNGVASDDPLLLRTQQNQATMVEYVKTKVR